MSYPERKNYRAIKAAKRYIKHSYMFDILVVLGGINILGSSVSIFNCLPYFIASLVVSLIVMTASYKASAYCEKQANKHIRSVIGNKADSTAAAAKKHKKNNIIRVDFRNKRICTDNRCSGM